MVGDAFVHVKLQVYTYSLTGLIVQLISRQVTLGFIHALFHFVLSFFNFREI